MNPIKHLILIFLLLTLSLANGQNKHSDKILTAGNGLAKAMISGNFGKIAYYTYPKIVEYMGGEDRMTAAIEDGMKQMERQGIKFSSVTIGEPQEIFQAGDELHCLVPQVIVMINGSGRVTNNSYLLAISNTNGESWYFIDTAQLTNEKAKELFPEFNVELRIPKKTAPIFESN
jgi:hypothetical protein